MENTPVIINPKEFGLEETKALELTSGLTTILTERETLKNAYLDVIDLELSNENLPIFKELRLKIVKNRTQGIEKWHKVNKEFFLTGGRFVDAVKNKEIAENERMESNLLEKEKHFENLEKERLKAVHLERVEKLLPLNYEIGNIDFSGMDENMFNAILLGAETAHKNKIEAEKQAELARLEVLRIEAEEKEKQRLEMIELKKQNEIKEKQLKLERIEAEKIRLDQKAKADAEAKKATDIIEAQRKTLEAERKASHEARLEVEKLAKEKALAEKAKADAELKEKQRIEAENKAKLEAEKKALKAPDKDKMTIWINELELLSIDLKSKESNATATEILTKFAGFKKWALEQVNTL